MGSENQYSGTFSAFLTGALVGAGVALLFAPQAGTEIRGLFRDYAARAKDEFDDAIERGAAIWDSTMERGREAVELGRKSLHEATRQAKGLAEDATQTVR